ncbi:hypothetical protein D3C76_1353130 [compost metagenome]
MPPVFEKFALTAAAPGDLVEQRLWITAQAGKQRQVVRAHQCIDRIDLHHAKALEHPLQMAGSHWRARRPRGEPLG